MFGRKIEGKVEGKEILGIRRKQLSDVVNGMRSYWNLRREHQFDLSGELALEDAMDLDHVMNGDVK